MNVVAVSRNVHKQSFANVNLVISLLLPNVIDIDLVTFNFKGYLTFNQTQYKLKLQDSRISELNEESGVCDCMQLILYSWAQQNSL